MIMIEDKDQEIYSRFRLLLTLAFSAGGADLFDGRQELGFVIAAASVEDKGSDGRVEDLA